MQTNICSGCGEPNPYTSKSPKGASPDFCKPCTTKRSERNKKVKLISIANNDRCSCRICGCNFIAALLLRDTIGFFDRPQPEVAALTQYPVCLNCNARIDEGDIEVKINNSKCTPVDVSFFEANIVIEKRVTEMKININSSDAESVEIIPDEEEIPAAEPRNVSRKAIVSGGE